MESTTEYDIELAIWISVFFFFTLNETNCIYVMCFLFYRIEFHTSNQNIPLHAWVRFQFYQSDCYDDMNVNDLENFLLKILFQRKLWIRHTPQLINLQINRINCTWSSLFIHSSAHDRKHASKPRITNMFLWKCK